MARHGLNLDVPAPADVADVLHRAADAYNESALELSAAWQEFDAGRPWQEIAKMLDIAADKIEQKYGRKAKR